MDDFIPRQEHIEFVARMKTEYKRLEDENERQNHRLNSLEAENKQLNELALSVSDLAASVKMIAKETERLGTRMEENVGKLDARLTSIEKMDGDKWRKGVWYIGTTVFGILIAYVFQQIGIF